MQVEILVHILVNGEPRQVARGASVADLVRALELRPEAVAVERNCRLVPRAAHGATPLESGDELEIVTLVGGG